MKILFVCTGNTCRSAMAAYMMNDIAVKEKLDVLIDSAGIYAADGDPATDEAIRAMKKRGIDLTPHRTKHLGMDLINQADIILTMTTAHKSVLAPLAEGKIYTLKEYADEIGDVADPFGGDDAEYDSTADEIYSLLKKISKKLPRDDG